MIFGPDYGDQPVETFMQDCENWVMSVAHKVCDKNFSLKDDVAQEGRIILWKAYQEYQGEEARIGKAMARAKRAMEGFAWKTDTPPTGSPRSQGHSDVTKQQLVRLDQPVGENGDGSLMDILLATDYLTDLEVAYHHGEIQQALAELTPGQRKYIYARFWVGIDMPAGSRSEVIKELKDQNPYLRRDVYWTGNKTSKGAKNILAEKLAHLHDLVRT